MNQNWPGLFTNGFRFIEIAKNNAVATDPRVVSDDGMDESIAAVKRID
jgi:hypothetical protein